MAWEKLGTTSVGGSVPNTSWKEIGRTTLGSSGSSIDVTSLSGKQNLMILADVRDMDNIHLTFNNDTGSNYAYSESINGGANATGTSQAKIELEAQAQQKQFSVSNVLNITAKEKLLIGHTVSNNNGGASNATARAEVVGKWANTSAQITSVKLSRTGSNDFASGSEVVVLGMDSDEADSGTNFWQELASVELSSTANEINSGTITAKKYLWIELLAIADGTISGSDLQFNGDTGSNYSRRYSNGGAADDTGTSETTLGGGTGGNQGYNYWYILNAADKEKTALGQAMWGSDGAGNAPSRRELSGKWANTSNQITSIKVKENGSGGWASGTILKVWGAD